MSVMETLPLLLAVEGYAESEPGVRGPWEWLLLCACKLELLLCACRFGLLLCAAS